MQPQYHYLTFSKLIKKLLIYIVLTNVTLIIFCWNQANKAHILGLLDVPLINRLPLHLPPRPHALPVYFLKELVFTLQNFQQLLILLTTSPTFLCPLYFLQIINGSRSLIRSSFISFISSLYLKHL